MRAVPDNKMIPLTRIEKNLKYLMRLFSPDNQSGHFNTVLYLRRYGTAHSIGATL